MPTGYKKRTWTDTRPNASPSTTDYTYINPAPNPRRFVERYANSRLKHVTAVKATECAGRVCNFGTHYMYPYSHLLNHGLKFRFS